jgi:hypothetical protein
MFVPPPGSGNTQAERTLSSILLRRNLPGLPAEIVTETPFGEQGSFSLAVAPSSQSCPHSSRGTQLPFSQAEQESSLLIGGLGGWFLASLPGLILAVLAFDGASRDELPVVASLTALKWIACSAVFLPCQPRRPSLIDSACRHSHAPSNLLDLPGR